MRKIFLFLISAFLLFSPAMLHASSRGLGGPILVATMGNMEVLNNYIAAYGLPAFNSLSISWGGSGVGFLGETIGIGGLACGGVETVFKDNCEARIMSGTYVFIIETSLIRAGFFNLLLSYGPGITTTAFSVLKDEMSEFYCYNILFYGGLSARMDVTETTQLELFAGYKYAPESSWKQLRGSLPVPDEINLACVMIGVGIKWGSTGAAGIQE